LVLKTIRILGETGFNPQRLEIEISEAALVSDIVAAREALSTFHQTGIRVALDDFGAGNSSLNHLRQVRFDRLKIDKSFIDGMDDSKEGPAFVRAIVGLGQALDVPVTAEGIEREEVVPRLLAEGCREGQGFAFGKAVPAEEVFHYLGAAAVRDEPV
jgi:EAL domain-containing protein (putative c-di-GMP-specific phosphodiesterase class I)